VVEDDYYHLGHPWEGPEKPGTLVMCELWKERDAKVFNRREMAATSLMAKI
jgi:hypothetical protein